VHTTFHKTRRLTLVRSEPVHDVEASLARCIGEQRQRIDDCASLVQHIADAWDRRGHAAAARELRTEIIGLLRTVDDQSVLALRRQLPNPDERERALAELFERERTALNALRALVRDARRVNMARLGEWRS
jgi:hypothetical protein